MFFSAPAKNVVSWTTGFKGSPLFTLLLQKPRMPQIQVVQGRSRSILLRALGNEGDGISSAFPPGKKHDKFLFSLDVTKSLFRKQVQKY